MMKSGERFVASATRGYGDELGLAVQDFVRSFESVRLAAALAWHDIVARYRGSLLGPLWITISMGAMVLGMGVVYAKLFRLDVGTYLPYIAIGFVLWNVISATINEGSEAFFSASSLLKQTNLPLPVFIWRVAFRSMINLGHHAIIVIAALVYFQIWGGVAILLSLVGFLLVIANLTWMGFLGALVSGRYRDIPQMISAAMQFLFFMSPVFWEAAQLGERAILLLINPVYYMLEAVRSPLLGRDVDPLVWTVLPALAIAGWLFTLLVYASQRRQVVHYL